MTTGSALPPPAPVADAVAHFAAALRFQTDPSDVAAARAAGAGPLVLDVRDRVAWTRGTSPGLATSRSPS